MPPVAPGRVLRACSSCPRSLQSPVLPCARIKPAVCWSCVWQEAENTSRKEKQNCVSTKEKEMLALISVRSLELGQKVCVLFILTSFLGTSGNTLSL